MNRRNNKFTSTVTGRGNNVNLGGDNVTQTSNTADDDADEIDDEDDEAPGAAAHDDVRDNVRDAVGTSNLDRTRNVFVVYGRDDQIRREMFEFFRRLDLRPLEWERLVHSTGEGTPYVGRVIADAPAMAAAAVVLLTPDDQVMLHPELRKVGEDRFELHPALQPRPNVLIELGMVLAHYPKNTIVLVFGEQRPIGDLAGRNVIRFNPAVSPVDALKKLAGRLQVAGCALDDSGTDWLDAGPFNALRAYRRKPL